MNCLNFHTYSTYAVTCAILFVVDVDSVMNAVFDATIPSVYYTTLLAANHIGFFWLLVASEDFYKVPKCTLGVGRGPL